MLNMQYSISVRVYEALSIHTLNLELMQVLEPHCYTQLSHSVRQFVREHSMFAEICTIRMTL